MIYVRVSFSIPKVLCFIDQDHKHDTNIFFNTNNKYHDCITYYYRVTHDRNGKCVREEDET